MGAWTGSPAPGFSYEWQRCDGAGANCVAVGGAVGQSYTLVAADVGHTMRAVVTGSNTAGSSAATSAQTVVVTGPPSPPVNTVAPAISGSTVSGQVLSVSNGTWTGSPAPGFSYEWQRCDGAGANCVAVGGAVGQSYTLVAADVGHTMRAVVTGSNTAGSSAATSAATGLISAAGGGSGTFGVTSVGTLTDGGGGGYLDLSGPFVVGQAVSVSKLTAYLGGGSSASKLRGVIYADNGGAPGVLVGTSNELSIAAGAAAGWVDLTLPSSLSLPAGSYWLGYWYADANSRHYYVDAAAAERYAPAAYSSTNPAPASFGTASTSTSNYSIYASYTTGGGGSPPVNTVAPAISGSTVSGQVLSVSNGSWTGSPAPGFSYQWQRCDGAGANCVAVGGAVGQSYTLVAADVGHTMRAVVTGSNTAGSSAATSAQTVVVTGPPSPPVNTVAPAISGSTVSGQVLSVSNGSWSGSPAPGFSYEWQRCDGAGANCVAVGGAVGQSYTLVAADVGHTMRAVVTGSNTAGSSAATSAQTVVVTGPPSPPVNTVAPAISGSTVSGQVLSVSNGSWSGSPAPGFSYQWQRCDGAGANCVAVGGAVGQSYTLVAADVGHTMRAVVTGSNSAGSSAASSVQTGPVSAWWWFGHVRGDQCGHAYRRWWRRLPRSVWSVCGRSGGQCEQVDRLSGRR